MNSEDYYRGYQEGSNNEKRNGSSGIFFVIVVIFILYFLVVKWGWNIPLFQNLFKYEGRTAEEWFYNYDAAESKYQDLYNCVEPYATADGDISSDDLYYECF